MEESERDLSLQQKAGKAPDSLALGKTKNVPGSPSGRGQADDSVLVRRAVQLDEEPESDNDGEPMRILCEPDKRQVKLTTSLPQTGRSKRNPTSSHRLQQDRERVTATTNVDSRPAPSVATSTDQRQARVKKVRVISRSDVIVIQYNNRYLRSCPGIFRVLQVLLSMICLICLTTSGSGKYESYLLLPLSWHFRIMVFVLVLTILTSLVMLVTYTTGLISTFPLNWPLLDLILYGTFTFLYLVGSSLVASAFDFYQKMGTDVPEQTIRRLVLCVVLGYMAMFLYLATAVHGYKKWRWLELHQFRRQRLMEADEIA